jgi:nitrite reductase/ring-hydroxylating ferredoxin subunit
MAEFVQVCDEADIPPGTGKAFDVGREEIGVFNVGGKFYAIDNLCRMRAGHWQRGRWPVISSPARCMDGARM